MKAVILIVDDDLRYRDLYAKTLQDAGFEVRTAISAEAAAAIIAAHEPAMVVSDIRMPGDSGLDLLRKTRAGHPALPFLLVTAYADVRDAVKALKLGAVDYLSKPVDLDEMTAAVRDALGVRAQNSIPDAPEKALKGIVAESPVMHAVLRDAYRIASSEANIVLTGESGTGKEVLARFIHENSSRRIKPMIAVNCAAIPASLLASELFGHEKGAFTGAVAKRLGKFREADGGTLFLDEIGDMPLELQASVLRAIETSRISPVGSDREVAVNYRLLAATNHDLAADAEHGRFRRDLYYRLNVINIEIPPLRERPEDILPLARHFLSKGRFEPIRISRAAVKALMAHSWPGNVRELANAMERARLLCQGDVLLPEYLPPAVCESRALEFADSSSAIFPEPAATGTLEENEIETIRRALEQTGDNRTRAAEILGITRRGLIYKLKRLGINPH